MHVVQLNFLSFSLALGLWSSKLQFFLRWEHKWSDLSLTLVPSCQAGNTGGDLLKPGSGSFGIETSFGVGISATACNHFWNSLSTLDFLGRWIKMNFWCMVAVIILLTYVMNFLRSRGIPSTMLLEKPMHFFANIIDLDLILSSVLWLLWRLEFNILAGFPYYCKMSINIGGVSPDFFVI